MGGEARLVRQHERGRLNARERHRGRCSIRARSSRSASSSARPSSPPVPGDALVAGSGRIDGRPALAGAEDVTVLGGSIGSGAADKRYRLCQLAAQERVPLVMMLEGAGHRVTDSVVGTPPGRPDGPGRAVRHRADGLPGARRVGRARRADRAAVRLRGDDRVRVDLRRRSAAREVGDRRGRDQGGARRPAVAVATRAWCTTWSPTTSRRSRWPAATSPTSRVNAWDAAAAGATGPDTGPRREIDMLELDPAGPAPPVPDPRGARVGRRRGRAARGAARLRPFDRHRARPPRRPQRGRRRQRPERAGRHRRQRRGRQGRPLPRRGRGVRPPVRLPGRQPRRAGRHARPSAAASCATRPACSRCSTVSEVPKLHVTLRKAFGFGSSIMAMNPFDGQTITLAFPSITLGALPASSEGSAIADPEERARVAAEQAAGVDHRRRPPRLRRRHRPPRAAQRAAGRAEPGRGAPSRRPAAASHGVLP